MKPTPQELREKLAYYTGTEQWYRHPLNRGMLYTEGVECFAEEAGAYWFLDIVATEVFRLQEAEHFLVIELQVESSDVCRIVVSDGNDNDVWMRGIDYTDCPLGLWKFYLTDNVIMLPGEY